MPAFSSPPEGFPLALLAAGFSLCFIETGDRGSSSAFSSCVPYDFCPFPFLRSVNLSSPAPALPLQAVPGWPESSFLSFLSCRPCLQYPLHTGPVAHPFDSLWFSISSPPLHQHSVPPSSSPSHLSTGGRWLRRGTFCSVLFPGCLQRKRILDKPRVQRRWCQAGSVDMLDGPEGRGAACWGGLQTTAWESVILEVLTPGATEIEIGVNML